MPKNRILPALGVALMVPLWAWAQQTADPGAAPDASPPAAAPADAAKPEGEAKAAKSEAEAKLDEAIQKVRTLESVSAKVTQKGHILGQNFVLEGSYARAPGHKIYLLLKLTGLGDVTGTMLQVSDGESLWDYTSLLSPPMPSCRLRRLGPILKRLDSPDADAELREAVLSQLGFAGPDALLVGLQNAIDFNQLDSGTFGETEVWILRGRWDDVDSLTGPNDPKIAPTAPLPPYVPSLVAVWIGKEDGWPYQVELSGRAPSALELSKLDLRPRDLEGRPVGRPITPPKVTPTRIVLNYTDVVLNPKLPASQFAFSPPEELEINDETEQIVSELEALLADRVARKKAEAAQLDAQSPELPGSLSVPVPGSEGEAPTPPSLPPIEGTRSTAPPL